MRRWSGLLLERLTIGSVHGWGGSHSTPNSMCWNESLSLRRDGGEDAILIEPHTVGTAAIVGVLETGAANLHIDCYKKKTSRTGFYGIRYLASPAVTAGNCGPLARCWRLVAMHVVLRMAAEDAQQIKTS